MTESFYESSDLGASKRHNLSPADPKGAVVSFFKNYAQFKGYSTRGEFWWPWLMLFLIHALIAVVAAVIIATAFPDAVTTGEQPPTGASAGGMSYGIWFEGASAVVIGISSLVHLAVFGVTISPVMAVTWRRLHDTGMPGPMFFLWFIPLVGWIIVLILLARPSRPEKHRPEWDAPRPLGS